MIEKEIAIKLLLAVVLSGLIGVERESLNRPAGFRTHILVCVGSTLTMLVSIFIFETYKTNADPGRIAAQVVSGIGFLGAGTIIKEGATVKGLTTAASLWAVACIGLAVGSGFYFGSVIATFFVFITLISLTKIENYVKKRNYTYLNILIEDKPGQIGNIGSKLGKNKVGIKNIRLIPSDEKKVTIELLVDKPTDVDLDKVLYELLEIEGIYDIDINN